MAEIAVVAVNRAPLFHLSVPLEVFGEDRTDDGVPQHTVRLVAGERGPLVTSGGATLALTSGLEALATADIVVLPWWRHYEGEQPPTRLLAAVRSAHQRGARVVGLCSGAWVLAAAGLLDGRRAATHWKSAEKLAREYPSVRVDPRVLYVDEGDVLTSAGTAAAIDLCLHLLRTLDGAEVANRVARRMVVAPHRSGGQAQFMETPLPVNGQDALSSTTAWALENLDQPLTVDALAARSHMSRRTFTRQFRARMGASPLQWLLQQRTLRAQRLLETTDLSIEAVAHRSGFGSAVGLRSHFQAALGTTPREYRIAFSRSGTAPLECAVAG